MLATATKYGFPLSVPYATDDQDAKGIVDWYQLITLLEYAAIVLLPPPTATNIGILFERPYVIYQFWLVGKDAVYHVVTFEEYITVDAPEPHPTKNGVLFEVPNAILVP